MQGKFDIVIFDLDSTLVTIEGLQWLSSILRQKDLPQIEASLEGKIPLKDAYHNELLLISPSYTDMLMLGNKYSDSFVDGAKSVIESLQLLGKEVWLMTNNFHPAIDVVANQLGIPLTSVYGSHLFFNTDGKYSGFDTKSPLVKNGGKADTVKNNIHPDMKVAMVGDAVLDLETMPVVDLFVGYGGVISRPKVKNEAHVFLESLSLLPLLELLLDEKELQQLKKQTVS